MRKFVATAFVASLLTAGAARAQAPAASGFTMAVRLGYGIPMGDALSGPGGSLKVDDFFGGKVPLWFDLGYRIDRSMFLGAYVEYGFGSVGSTLDSACVANGESCSTSMLRIGAEFLYKFSPDASFAPWLGIGLGYESATVKESIPGLGSATTSFSGFEFLNLQVGGDFRVSPAFALGPYVALSVGQYSSIEGITGFTTTTHEWLQFGLKGTFDL